MTKSPLRDNLILILGLLFFVILFSWDLGNPDAIRQGTEGFYLKVSKEMFDKNSVLTPYYLGVPHWSKPPLVFYFPWLFTLFSDSYLFAARIAILVFSFASIFYCSKVISHSTKYKWSEVLFVLISSFGFLKYSRIYMFESPLAILITLSAYLFFAFSEKPSRYYFIASAVVAGLSIMVKGPVSFVILCGSIGTYFIYHRHFLKKRSLTYTHLIGWGTISLFVGSIWFVLCYLKYGNEFFHYFFLRENLGKFSAKNYPITVLFQGLMIFSFPWSIFLIEALITSRSYLRGIFKEKIFIFSLSCFIPSFFIWFIPAQKSHHYAMPSIFFFLFMIFILLKRVPLERLIFSRAFHVFVGILLSTLCLISFRFEEFFTHIYQYLLISISIFVIIAHLYILIKSRSSIIRTSISFTVFLAFAWNVLSGIFILPVVPSVLNHLEKAHIPVFVNYRKPYFVEESLDRKVSVIDANDIGKIASREQAHFFTSEKIYKNIQSSVKNKVLHRWVVWKRGSKAGEILNAIKSGDLSTIQEYYVYFSTLDQDI